MGARVTQLAKISRPQVHGVLPRERLFARLDKTRLHPVTWISAPPGAGKTTTVTAYLEARKIGGLWYQVDRDDADPATFCYFLGLAERQVKSRKRPLPLLTPEYLADLPRYSRRFFQEMFSRLPQGQALVLDNFQEVPEDSAFHQVIEAGLEQIPDGLSVIVISRLDPPQQYSRLVANRRIALLDWETMKLTQEEARGIAALAKGAVGPEADLLHEKSGGWCAGLILLLESGGLGEAPESKPEANALQGIFGYFASQLFDRMPAEQRDALLRLSCFPSITIPTAQAITGNPNVAKLLETLYHRHLFTDRRESAVPHRTGQPTDTHAYQFHALFIAFLRQQAESLLGYEQMRSLKRRSANLLRNAAQVEAAFDLFAEAADWDAARSLVLSEAERFLGEGRWKTLVGWIEQIPPDIRIEDPWLLHWMGVATMASDPAAARAPLERAYDVAMRRPDRLCAIQSVASIVETHVLEYTDLRACDKWLPILDTAFSEGIEFDSPESEARSLAAFLNALVYRDPGHPNIERYVDRALLLFDSSLSADLRTTLSVPLNYWGTNCGRLAVATHVISTLEPVIEASAVSDLRKALFYYATLHYYTFLTANATKALDVLGRMRALATDTGFAFIDSWAAHCAGSLPARMRNIDGIEKWLKVMDRSITERAYDHAMRATFAAMWTGVMGGNPRVAREAALRSMELMDKVGFVPHQFFNLNALLWAASETRDLHELEHWVRFSRELANSTRIQLYAPSILAAQARAYCAIGDRVRGEAALREVMDWAKCRSQGICAAIFLVGWMRDLCELALEYGIETDFAKATIRENGYKPSAPGAANWPWPVRIYTLGEFRIAIDDQPLRHSRKSPKRLLLLLKDLIAQGANDVPIERLIDDLWGDSEADTARSAVSIAIRRLRDLLGREDALLLKGGLLSLNRDVCWVDALAFETMLQSRDRTSIESAVALYRGPFLRDDTSAAWAFSRKDRLHEKFVHHTNGIARELENTQDWDAAERCYLHGLDMDDTTESFYQGLIRCHVAHGKRSEARRAYDRMGQRLMEKLGMKPSSASTALYRTLLAE